MQYQDINLWAKNFVCQYRVIDWLFAVLSHVQEFFTYMEISPLSVKSC
jgi:hypothetical protein